MMRELLIWSLQASLVLAVLFGAYQLLFRRSSATKLNRAILLLIVICAVSFPLIQMEMNSSLGSALQNNSLLNSIEAASPIQKELAPTSTNQIGNEVKEVRLDWWKYASITYLIGMAISTLILLIEIFRLIKLRKSGVSGLVLSRKVIFHPNISSPFSFFQWIFLPGQGNYDSQTWAVIKEHEDVHLRQWHTVDLLLSGTLQILCWYNPFIYWFGKTVKQNHEFLADSETLKTVDLKTYTQTLLNISLNGSENSFAHSFALRSSLANRLVLMKTQKTNTMKTFRNLFAFIMIGTLTFFQISVYGQSHEPKSEGLFTNGTLFFAGGGKEGTSFSSFEINDKFGKTPDGWIRDHKASRYTPIMLLEERKELIREIAKQQDDDLFLERAFIQMSPTAEAEELMKSPAISMINRKHTTINLSTEELVSMYELSKAWFNNYVKPIYPEQEFISEPEFLKNKYLILFSPNYEGYPANSSERIISTSEIDFLPSPKGGLERFISNVVKQAATNADLSVLNEDIAFNLIVGMNGKISHLELASEVSGSLDIQDKKYEALGAINQQILTLSDLYGWNSAKKSDRRVSTNYRLEIPKTSF